MTESKNVITAEDVLHWAVVNKEINIVNILFGYPMDDGHIINIQLWKEFYTACEVGNNEYIAMLEDLSQDGFFKMLNYDEYMKKAFIPIATNEFPNFVFLFCRARYLTYDYMYEYCKKNSSPEFLAIIEKEYALFEEHGYSHCPCIPNKQDTHNH